MKILRFRIENFKGVKSTTLDLQADPPGNVVTLIGLNESGKTTVLEALSHFVAADADTSSIVNTISADQSPQELIPKGREANFTGDIVIAAEVGLDDEDVAGLTRYLKTHAGVDLINEKCPRSFEVSRVYEFVDSEFVNKASRYAFNPVFTKKGQTKKHAASKPGSSAAIWETATDYIAENFPKIVYFPTFLFSVPEKIYLEEPPEWASEDERITNAYFVQVLQDVADSLEQDISLQQHIVERVRRKRDNFEGISAFFAAFMSMDESSQIRAVAGKLSGAMTRTIFGAWNEIFDHAVSRKSVKIDWGLDTERGGIPWLQLQIHDGDQAYAVHERSLGFRWFFTFLRNSGRADVQNKAQYFSSTSPRRTYTPALKLGSGLIRATT